MELQEIDALVEQQRLQRLERQRCEEDAARLAQQQEAAVFDSSCSSGNSDNHQHQHPAAGSQISDGKHASCKGSSNCKASSRSCSNHMPADKSNKSCKDIAAAGAVAGGWRGKESQRAKQVQQQSMRAAVESRRRLARGPRSGVLPDNAHGGANSPGPMLPSEDHRVVSTEYQAAGTQALMRVTLLAAGFVIGARGISARLIGQVTGAIVQSWTESCRYSYIPPSPPLPSSSEPMSMRPMHMTAHGKDIHYGVAANCEMLKQEMGVTAEPQEFH